MSNGRRRLLVVVAHPDDETFGTGSVIASAAAAGAEVVVCCATRGEAGEARGLAPGADLAAVREAELRAAGELLGVSRFVLLGLGDSGMSGEPAPGTLAATPLTDLVDAVRKVLADVDPQVVVTLDPDHGDGHRDHVVMAKAVLEACRELSSIRVYAWALPRVLLGQWFDELEWERPDSGHLDLDREGLGRPDADITTVLDASRVRDVRERAIALHASQVSPYDGMPTDLRDQFLQTDRLVRLQPPWEGGTPEHHLF